MAKKTELSKSIDSYEKIFVSAWRTTWKHTEYWLFGFLASLVFSGSLFFSVFSHAMQIKPATNITIQTIFSGKGIFSYMADFTRNLLVISLPRMIFMIILVVLISAFFLIIILIAQHILIHALHRNEHKKIRLDIQNIFSEIKHSKLLQLFTINALVRIFSIIILAAASILLAVFLTNSIGINLLVNIAVYTLVLPLLFFLNVLAMFMFMRTSGHHEGLHKAFEKSIHTLKKNWLPAIEISCMLFLIDFFALSAITLGTGILFLLGLPLYLAIGLDGSSLLILIVTFLHIISIGFITILFLGGITTYNYSVWTIVTKKFMHKHSFLSVFETFLSPKA